VFTKLADFLIDNNHTLERSWVKYNHGKVLRSQKKILINIGGVQKKKLENI
jgi:hypothetical protein